MTLAAALLILFTHTVSLHWTPNTEPDLAGYKVYRGLQSCVSSPDLQLLKDVGLVVTFDDTTIPVTATAVCYAVTAYDHTGNESPLSAHVGKTVNLTPGAPTSPSFH